MIRVVTRIIELLRAPLSSLSSIELCVFSCPFYYVFWYSISKSVYHFCIFVAFLCISICMFLQMI